MLLKATALMPFCASDSVWSFISAISGLITTVEPSITRAGSWKQRLLPEPVGIKATVSRPESAERTTFSCPGRNLRKPKCSRSLDLNPEPEAVA